MGMMVGQFRVRHETIHAPNQDHTNPHDHNIRYDPHTHSPIREKPQINYPAEQYPNGAPEFKGMQLGEIRMNLVYWCDAEAWRFKTISEFKDSLRRGGEIVVEWKENSYGIFYNGKKFYIVDTSMHPTYFDTPDELLEYMVGNDRLRDIITKVEVTDRSL